MAVPRSGGNDSPSDALSLRAGRISRLGMRAPADDPVGEIVVYQYMTALMKKYVKSFLSMVSTVNDDLVAIEINSVLGVSFQADAVAFIKKPRFNYFK